VALSGPDHAIRDNHGTGNHKCPLMNEPNIANLAWLGLDAHARFCVLGWLDQEGRRRGCWRFATSEAALIEHLQRIPATIKRLSVEECGLGRWLAGVARPHVKEAIVCDPRENHHISRHHHKCDEEDAYRLAHLHRLGSLKAVWQPDDERALFRNAVQGFLEAVQRQSVLKVQIKARYRQWGVIPSGSAVFSGPGRVAWLERLPHARLRAQLGLLYAMLDAAGKVRAQARRLMLDAGRAFPEVERLRTFPGVGIVGAHAFVAWVGEPARFATAQKLFRYCRLGIRDRSSDGKPLGYQRLDRSTGHGVLKAISYRAWLWALRSREGAVYQFYRQSLERTGEATHARLNTQRKVLQCLWVMWRQGRPFHPERFLGSAHSIPAKATCS
jgi:transposase